MGGCLIVNEFKCRVGRLFVKCKCLHNDGSGKLINESQCEKTQDTVKENWSEKMLPNYQILC